MTWNKRAGMEWIKMIIRLVFKYSYSHMFLPCLMLYSKRWARNILGWLLATSVADTSYYNHSFFTFFWKGARNAWVASRNANGSHRYFSSNPKRFVFYWFSSFRSCCRFRDSTLSSILTPISMFVFLPIVGNGTRKWCNDYGELVSRD